MRVLIIEDEEKVCSFIRKGLEREGFATVIAADGAAGLEMALRESFDVIVLDLMLPEMDGIAVLRELRKRGLRTHVIILTARAGVQDRIDGLNAGADDYLPKPFAFGELLARIRALLRRDSTLKNPVMTFDDLVIDPIKREVFRGGRPIDLSAKEYALLEFVAYNANRALNRTTIAEHVWSYNFDPGTNVIDVYINRIRKKIDEGHKTKLIHTIRGYGYMLRGDT